MKYLYLIVNIFSLIVPLIFSFHPRLNFYKKWLQAWPAILVTATVFVLWDMYYTHLEVWGFNPLYISGVYLLNLPVEEILFFICIPYSCLFTYHCLNLLVVKELGRRTEKQITIALILFLLPTGIICGYLLYTSATFILLGCMLIALYRYFRVKWLNRFYVAWFVLLLPFLIVNGILTGTGLDEPVVWYDNLENLNIRLLTIPVEDVFYGMLLILVNVCIYEYLNRNYAA